MTDRPSTQVCPLCSRDDTVEVLGRVEHEWAFRCANLSKHVLYEWSSPDASVLEEESAPGIMQELELFTDLPHCLVASERFVEYGIVEHRYRTMRPETYAAIVARYGHRATEVGRHYTASSFMASALKLLSNREELELRWGSATGFWRYNEVVSYWALAPARTDKLLSWVDFALAEGIDPDIWVI